MRVIVGCYWTKVYEKVFANELVGKVALHLEILVAVGTHQIIEHLARITHHFITKVARNKILFFKISELLLRRGRAVSDGQMAFSRLNARKSNLLLCRREGPRQSLAVSAS